MKKKRRFLIIIAVVLGFILLFPIRLHLKDGGSRVYRSLIGIYEITNWRQRGYIEEGYETLKTGITVELFGMKVFDNSKTEIVTEE